MPRQRPRDDGRERERDPVDEKHLSLEAREDFLGNDHLGIDAPKFRFDGDPAKVLSDVLELGSAHYGKGQLDEAIAEYRKAVELDPDIADSHNNLGLALYGKGQLDEAIAEYRKAIELGPD